MKILEEYIGKWFEILYGPKKGKYKIIGIDPSYPNPSFVTSDKSKWSNPDLLIKRNDIGNYSKWLDSKTVSDIEI